MLRFIPLKGAKKRGDLNENRKIWKERFFRKA